MTDFSKLHFVSKANPRKSKYDIQMLKDDQFRISSEAFTRLGLDVNGMTQVNDIDKLFIGITTSENSVFYKTTSKGEKKNLTFKNRNLAVKLQELFQASPKDMFKLDYSGDYKDYKMYSLLPINETKTENVPVEDTSQPEPAPESPKEEDIKSEEIIVESKELKSDVPSEDYELY